jgi:GWxTD domain-containing protein
MRRKWLRLAVAAGMTVTFTGVVSGEEFRKFLEGPAQWIATKEEKKEFAKLTTEVQAKAWVELFWARRDPDLNTPVNEFKLDFDQRVVAADKLFTWEKQRGALSDRGRTLIVLGRPNKVQSVPAGNVGGTPLGEGGGWQSEGLDRQGAAEIWEYTAAQLPKGVKGNQVLFIFVESKVGTNDFQLSRADRRNALAQRLWLEAGEATLLHPKLTEVPRLGLVAKSKAASPQQLAVLDAAERPWPAGAQVLAREGLMSALMHPLWVHLFVPDAVPEADQAIGRVRRGGEETGSFVVAAEPLSVPGGRAYEFSIPVEAGAWEVDLALLKQGSPLAVTTVSVTTEKVPEEGTYISPFFWGVDVRQEVQAHLGDPFNVGGWRILPRLGDRYTSDESLAYFCFVVRPVVKPEGTVDAELTLNLFYGDRKVAELPTQNVSLSRITDDLWMMGSSLPLKGLRRPGDYRLEITLKEVGSGVSKTVAVPITIPAPPAAAEGGS